MPTRHRARAPMNSCLASALLLAAASATAQTTFLHCPLEGGDQAATIVGVPGHGFGSRVLVGDIDGDARPDLLVDAYLGRCCGLGQDSGTVHAFLSRSSWPERWDMSTTPSDVTFGPADARDWLKLGALGDLNGDGMSDIMFVASGGDGPDNTRAGSGELHVRFGRTDWSPAVTPITETPDVTIHGAGGGLTLTSADVGDVNGDGMLDVVALASSSGVRRLVLVLGRPAWPPVIDLATEPPDAEILNLPPFGWYFSAGDITGDGAAEIAVDGDSGRSVLVFAGRRDWPRFIDYATDGADAAIAVTTPATSLMTQVVGSPTLDLVISDDASGPGGYRRGRVRVHEGGPAVLSAPAVATVLGRDDNDRSAAAGTADLDLDGLPDLVISSDGSGPRDRRAGSVLGGEMAVIAAPLPETSSLDDVASRLTAYGIGNNRRGIAGGDLNGDGRADIAAGTGFADGVVMLLLTPLDLVPSPPPATVHADAMLGDDANDGLSWASAKRTLTGALDALDLQPPGRATIRVAEGAYPGTLSVGKATTLLGGHPSGGGSRLDRNPTARPTIVDGQAVGTTISVRAGAADEGVIVDGFVITNGWAELGGGMRLETGSVLLQNNVITRNVAVATSSPAMSVQCPNPDTGVMEPFYTACNYPHSGRGTGIYSTADDVVIRNNLVVDNDVELFSWPGCWQPPNEWWECFGFYDGRNKGVWGTGAAILGGAMTIESTTVAENYGQGIVGGSGLRVEDSIAVTASTGYDALIAGGDGNVISHSVIGRTSVALDATNLRGSPLFADAANGDFSLSDTDAGQAERSPAIDAGSMPASDACLDPSPCLDAFTTRTDGELDTGQLDIGYHAYVVPRNLPPDFGGPPSVATSGDCALEIAWQGAADPEGDSPITFRVYRGTAPGAQDLANPVAVLDASARSFVNRDVAFGVGYWYLVRAMDSLGEEDANVAEVTGMPADLTDPDAALVVNQEPSGCNVVLTFTAEDACSGLDYVDLHRSGVPGFAPEASTLVAMSPRSPHVDTVPGNGNWYYRLVVSDRAGLGVMSRQDGTHVAGCDGSVVPPGEAFIPTATKIAAGLNIPFRPAPGADFHRLYRGDLLALGPDYVHGASLGLDGLPGTDDDLGACRVDSLVATDGNAMQPGSFYYLVAGVNAAGEGPHGLDSFGRAGADGTTGMSDCP